MVKIPSTVELESYGKILPTGVKTLPKRSPETPDRGLLRGSMVIIAISEQRSSKANP